MEQISIDSSGAVTPHDDHNVLQAPHAARNSVSTEAMRYITEDSAPATATMADNAKTEARKSSSSLHSIRTRVDSPTVTASSSADEYDSEYDQARTPTQESAVISFDICVSTDTPQPHSLPSTGHSQQADSPSEPSTPSTSSTPSTPATSHDVTRDSMTSIALSETSLDYDHLSPEQVEDVLATPRVSGARRHLRKVSSLDILQNRWAPSEPSSTLFDTSDDAVREPASASDLRGDTSAWTRNSDELRLRNVDFRSGPADVALATMDMLEPALSRSGSVSDGSFRKSDGSSSEEESQVDWQALDKTEEQEKEDKDLAEGEEDESTAFLLARLEQENAKFATDPKAASNRPSARARAASRPPSMAQLKKLVTAQDTPSIRYSLASDNGAREVPPMTELEYWTALVQDYPSTATRLPTLTTTKIRGGIPPPLRGVVWASMAGARDKDLEDAYERLVHEKSSYEGIINKDVGRSFPGVDLFREADGEGQKMLGRVLKCFSLQDKDIGYCQGLGFLVGPLLMNMGERDAFCVLVRLMDHYSLRPSFLPSLSGLHMRIYQFSSLLKQHNAKLHSHLAILGIEPAYLSQWFLSCFAVTCPLTMLFRIYDVIFAEGANETVMRVALALMRRHEERMLATTEFEDVMQLLLGREMFDCYGGDADELVDDFTSLGDIVTHARLAELEKEFESQSSEAVSQSAGFLPDVQAAASRFLGRLWTPSHASTASKPVPNTAPAHIQTPSVSTLSPQSAGRDAPSVGYSIFGRPGSFLRRSPSKTNLDLSNDSNSSDDSASIAGSAAASLTSTAPTELETLPVNATGTLRESYADTMSLKSKPDSLLPMHSSFHGRETQDLHAQIEDLLTAMGEMQREQAQLAAMLQREREDRGEDQKVLREFVGKLRKGTKEDRRKTMPATSPSNKNRLEVSAQNRPLSVGNQNEVDRRSEKEKTRDDVDILLDKAQDRLQTNSRFSVNLETKAQLRSTLARTREQVAIGERRLQDLTTRLESAGAAVSTFQAESDDLRAEVKELRVRVADDFRTRQKLEHQLNDFKAQARSIERKERLQRAESLQELPALSRLESSSDFRSRKDSVSSLPTGSATAASGLRELRLGRRDSSSSIHSIRPTSRHRTPFQFENAIPAGRVSDGSSSESDSPATTSPQIVETAPSPSVLAPPGNLAVVPRTGFARRTSSLAAKEVLATPQHEPVPEEALLLELVNSKTSEAQARQEVDELKKALSVTKRKQEESLNQLRAEIEAAKAEAVKAQEAANAAKAETAAVRMSQLASATNPQFSLPPTPGREEGQGESIAGAESSPKATPNEEKTPDLIVPKKTETPPASGGGWFWSRRVPSKGNIIVQKEGE